MTEQLHDAPDPGELSGLIREFLEEDPLAVISAEVAPQVRDATVAFDRDVRAGSVPANELRMLLADEVLPITSDAGRYHVRVAIRATEVVLRQMSEPGEVGHHYQRCLEDLGFADTAALAEAIRCGGAENGYQEITTMLRHAVREKVRVANPDYLRQDGNPEPFVPARARECES